MSVVERKFVPSALQAAFFTELMSGTSNIVLVAVAGSGKSTTLIESIPMLPQRARVKFLSFGNRIVADLKAKKEKLEQRMGQKYPNVWIQTFHSVGNGLLMQFYKSRNITPVGPSDKKLRNILKTKLNEEDYFRYGKFCADLVSYAKGAGLGLPGIAENDEDNYYEIIEHHGLTLDNSEAKLERAVHIARALLVASFKAARDEGIFDFDDMLYMPIALDLRFWKEDLVFCDEAQDTNRLRREFLRRMMGPRSRLVAVGDPKQAIMGFTGATNDALNVIKEEFNCKEMMLNVSYRCPKSIVSKVKSLVSYFEVFEGNAEGDNFDIEFKDLIDIVRDEDAIVCRNVAPLVSLAFKLIGKGRACHVLGSEIGKGLVTLVKLMDASNINQLSAMIDAWRDREAAALREKDKEDRAQAIEDKALCITTMIETLPESMRTVDGLISRIENLFKDEDRTLCLSSIHKAKGREWYNVVIYCPERMPSPWARQPWMMEQEENLEYVALTRATNWTMYLPEVK